MRLSLSLELYEFNVYCLDHFIKSALTTSSASLSRPVLMLCWAKNHRTANVEAELILKVSGKATRWSVASSVCVGRKMEAAFICFHPLVFHAFLFIHLRTWVCTFYSSTDSVCIRRGAWLSFRQHVAPPLDEVTIKPRPASQARKYWFPLIG